MDTLLFVLPLALSLVFGLIAFVVNYFIQKKAFENGLVDANKKITEKKEKNVTKDLLTPSAKKVKETEEYQLNKKEMTEDVLPIDEKSVSSL